MLIAILYYIKYLLQYIAYGKNIIVYGEHKNIIMLLYLLLCYVPFIMHIKYNTASIYIKHYNKLHISYTNMLKYSIHPYKLKYLLR